MTPAQRTTLEQIILQDSVLKTVLERAPQLALANYYAGAGCVAQTVWNHLFGLPPAYGISDIDLVYFDDDLSSESENAVVQEACLLFSDLKIPVDVKNEARVHLWYEDHFGYPIEPYESLEDAIDTWPTTATAVGLRMDFSGCLQIYAPFGLDDLFSGTVRANKAQITEEIYRLKVRKWTRKWPGLKIIPW